MLYCNGMALSPRNGYRGIDLLLALPECLA